MNLNIRTIRNTIMTDIQTFKNSYFKLFPAEKHTLNNGLKVILMENHDLPVISMYTFFKVGSRNERPGITGISHLFEHMMFNGSRKYGPKEFDSILESGGGHSNAYTSRDVTVYYEDFSSNLLETVLDLESDRMGWLDLTVKNLDPEREVVKEERRLRTDNSIMGRLDEELYAASFQCHPYRWPIIGWMPDIENITAKDCRDYHKKYYAPGNAVLVLSGDFKPEQVIKLIEKYYGQIPARKTTEPPNTYEPVQKGEKRLRYKKNSELDNLIIGYHVPGIGHEDLCALDVLQTILTDGESSVLHKSLVRKKAAVLSIFCEFTWHIDPGLFEFYLQMKPGFTYKDGEALLETELRFIAERKISKNTMEKAKNILIADFIKAMQTNHGRAHRLGLNEVILDGYEKLFDPYLEYLKVDQDQVKEVIRKYIHNDNKTIVWLENENNHS
ncbi:M16 family metallopeptidase [candidate division KSB1 bacterium]